MDNGRDFKDYVMMEPSLRKPLGMLLILLLITVWVVIIATFSPEIGQLPGFAQAIVYIFAGIAWIFPIKPLLNWIETGKINPK
jgi:Protein of unknown function (DUF2842)